MPLSCRGPTPQRRHLPLHSAEAGGDRFDQIIVFHGFALCTTLQRLSPRHSLPAVRTGSMAVFQDLPLDVIDRLFTTLDDFDSLAALLRTCKRISQVFAHHPKSIVLSVAYNLVGPTLVQAVACMRDDDEAFISKRLGDLHISRTEMRTLADNAALVSKVEDVYSLRFVRLLSRCAQCPTQMTVAAAAKIGRRREAGSRTTNVPASVAPFIVSGKSMSVSVLLSTQGFLPDMATTMTGSKQNMKNTWRRA